MPAFIFCRAASSNMICFAMVVCSFSLFVCVGATYQDGHLMPSLGEFGFSARVGPTIGWATKPPDEREDASIGGSLTYIVGTGGKLGVWSEEPKSPGVDYEQYFNSGLGFSFGPAKTWSIKLW